MILDHVSHSQVNMWQRCPRQWEYRYVKGLKSPPSGALVLGGSYHEALEGNYKQKVESKVDLPLDSCLDMFSDLWEKRVKEEGEVLWEDHPESIKDLGYALVREYQLSTAPSVQPAEVEQIYVKEIVGVKFVCRVDLVNDAKIVIDHKTSNRKFNQVDVDSDIQASAEAFALGRSIVFQNHIAIKAADPWIQVVSSYRLGVDIEWWLSMVTDVIFQMKTGAAPPRSIDAFGKRGYWCTERFCGYYELCRPGLARSTFT